jgi:hypothetical protein
MKFSISPRLAAAAFLMLASACTGSSLPTSAPVGSSSSFSNASRATQGDLLYAFTIEGDGFVWSYPSGGLLASFTITGATGVWGACTDSSGDVFVTVEESSKSSYIYEYAHGGTKPIAKLSDDGYTANDCASDPTTGNLAVTNYDDSSSGRSNVAIYADARGTPKHYTDSKMSVGFCGYDADGNLFVDGSGTYQLAELPKGGGALKNIRLNKSIQQPAGVVWDGKELALEQSGFARRLWAIERVDVTGGAGKVTQTMYAKGLANRGRTFFIDGATIGTVGGQGVDRIGLWKYPTGGEVVKIYYPRHTDGQTLYGIALSLAQPR